MKFWFALIIILLVFSSVLGQSVTVSDSLGNTTKTTAFLQTQFRKMDLNGATIIIMPAVNGEYFGWLLSQDSGNTFELVDAQWATAGGIETRYPSDHSSMVLSSDGMGITSRIGSSGDPAQFRFVAWPCTSKVDMEPADTISETLDTYLSEIAVQSDSTYWITSQDTETDSTLRIFWSNDHYTTVNVERVCNCPVESGVTSQNGLRAGVEINTVTGQPYVVLFHFDPAGAVSPGIFMFQRTGVNTWDSTAVYEGSIGAGDRQLSFTCVTLSSQPRIQIVFRSLTENQIVAFEEAGDGSFDSVLVSSVTPEGANVVPHYSVWNNGNSGYIYCMFTVSDGSGGTMAVAKRRAINGGSWGDSVVVSGPTHNPAHVVAPMYIPSGYQYVPMAYRDNTTGNIYYVELSVPDNAVTARRVAGSTIRGNW